MQAGACTTAFNAGFKDESLSNWKGETFPESSENNVGFKQKNEGEYNHIDLSNWNDKPLSELSESTVSFQYEKDEKVDSLEGENDSKNLSKWNEPKPVKTRKGGGDTQTKGKHSTRYNAYYKAVKTGKINPTIYGLTNHKIDGVGIGVETARTFLQAMEKAGLVHKVEKGTKTTWARCV